MELISWSEKYSVNNYFIDSHHKKLIGFINKLHKSLKNGKEKETLEKIFDELLFFTQNHFAMEERLMAASRYPELNEHKKAHQFLEKKVMDLQKKFIDGNALYNEEVMNFLKSWLVNHIEGMDQKYKGKI